MLMMQKKLKSLKNDKVEIGNKTFFDQLSEIAQITDTLIWK
jgi:hypothetical protein